MDDASPVWPCSIYWEAKGKDSTDMELAANVVMNRLGHEGFPDTVCAVVKQGSETKSCQFSWWCDGVRLGSGGGPLRDRQGNRT